MKKFFITVLALGVFYTSSTAGELLGRAQLCANFSRFSHDSLATGEELTTSTFFSFGVGVESPVDAAGTMSILGELWYMSKGGGFDESGSMFGTTYHYASTYRLSYLQINPLFQYNFMKDRTMSIRGFAGPGVAILLGNNASQEYTYGTTTNSADTSLPNSTFSSLELSLIVGAEAVYAIDKNMDVVGGLRYNIGLTNVDNPDDPPNSKESVMKISAFTVAAGIRIRL